MQNLSLLKLGFTYEYDDFHKLEIYIKPIQKNGEKNFTYQEKIYANGQKL